MHSININNLSQVSRTLILDEYCPLCDNELRVIYIDENGSSYVCSQCNIEYFSV
jgi:transposase-like protein